MTKIEKILCPLDFFEYLNEALELPIQFAEKNETTQAKLFKAEASQTDPIVLGFHRRRVRKRILIGSVAESPLGQAPCALMIYKKLIIN